MSTESETGTDSAAATVTPDATETVKVYVDPIPTFAYLLVGIGLLAGGQAMFERGLDYLAHGKPEFVTSP